MSARVRLRLDIRYHGGRFHGWARQPGRASVQGSIETALSTVLRHRVELTVAGRTDAGVHATGQVAHVDVEEAALDALAPATPLVVLTKRVNALLWHDANERTGDKLPGADIVVTAISVVDDTFDARFSALTRHYVYTLGSGLGAHDPLRADTRWWVGERDLDLNAMSEAATILVGDHDFLSFCKPREGATTRRTVRSLEVVEIARGSADLTAMLGSSSRDIEVRVSADAFCHSMVRSIVGALVEVGRGRRESAWIRKLIDHPSRTGAAPVAPPHGLTLVRVDYPPAEQWGAQQQVTRRRRDEQPCCR